MIEWDEKGIDLQKVIQLFQQKLDEGFTHVDIEYERGYYPGDPTGAENWEFVK